MSNLNDAGANATGTRSAVHSQLAERFHGAGPEHCLSQRADGVYTDPAVLGTTLCAAVDAILRSGSRFAGLDYPVLLAALYGCGAALDSGVPVRLARDIVPFDAGRRSLYRSVKITDGQAEYCFEPVFLPGADGEGEVAASLDTDEFIADMWLKGIRFGVDLAAVSAGIANPAIGRTVVARRLAPGASQDACVVEVSDDIHRSNAPRQLANGKLDLMRFQNRFPQVEAGTCLLRKLPPRPGTHGVELSGLRIEPAAPNELDFTVYAGSGTAIERGADGDCLLATRTGFLNVDTKTHQVSIDDKIVSRDGVSARTTGNLQLSGDYEEFGEVQEKRVIDGASITVHADVYGDIVSRGGSVRLLANLVGGSAHNKAGDIVVEGVAASAVIMAAAGMVTLARAENCVVAGTRVCIAHAVNCDIVGDEVTIGQAEGCAVAGRSITIDSTAPWRDSDMLVHVLCAECGKIDEVLGQIGERLALCEAIVARHRNDLAQLCAQGPVRQYLEIAAQVRAGQTVLAPHQEAGFRQMGQAVAPQLQKIGEIGAARKTAEADLAQGQALQARFSAQRAERAGRSELTIAAVRGETAVRTLAFDPDAAPFHQQGAREIRQRLRGIEGEGLHTLAEGNYHWNNLGEPGSN